MDGTASTIFEHESVHTSTSLQPDDAAGNGTIDEALPAQTAARPFLVFPQTPKARREFILTQPLPAVFAMFERAYIQLPSVVVQLRQSKISTPRSRGIMKVAGSSGMVRPNMPNTSQFGRTAERKRIKRMELEHIIQMPHLLNPRGVWMEWIPGRPNPLDVDALRYRSHTYFNLPFQLPNDSSREEWQSAFVAEFPLGVLCSVQALVRSLEAADAMEEAAEHEDGSRAAVRANALWTLGVRKRILARRRVMYVLEELHGLRCQIAVDASRGRVADEDVLDRVVFEQWGRRVQAIWNGNEKEWRRKSRSTAW